MLIPAIIQDAYSKEVLMLGYMNEEALEKTKKDGKVTFFSRSKNRLWQKGETSGNFLEVISIRMDCDKDTILIEAIPNGPTCHNGTQSCFKTETFNIGSLFSLMKKRKQEMPTNSYTTKLFKEGQKLILSKIEEESEEVIRAAKSEGKQRLIEESCDLIYHLLVLNVLEGIELQEINDELAKRNGKESFIPQ